MPPKLLLIDALNLIRRVHAAVRATDDVSQVEGALSSMRSSLARAIKDYQPTHALMVFDGTPPTWRHALYPQYKEGRKPMPEALRVRLGEFNQAILQMGIKTFRRSGLEADDVIAATACKAAKVNVDVRILSTDRIFLQLLTHPGIHLHDHFQSRDLNQQTVFDTFGIKTERLIDFWSMAGVGDVPGVHGVGDKGAKTLINDYGTLDSVLDGVVAQGETAKGAARRVSAQKEQALLSRKLATLATDIELGIPLKALRYPL